jgi:transposase InsO family protein
MTEARTDIMTLIGEAIAAGARQKQACEVIGFSAKTLQRWHQPAHPQDGRLTSQHRPKNKLDDLEKQRIINLMNQTEYAHLPPSQIVPKLADIGQYLASESTLYRLLREHHQQRHRDKSKPDRHVHKPKACTATGPNQIYTWDITYLPTSVKGMFFYLYLVMDIFSRKIVGWQIHDNESSYLSADLLKDIYSRENILPGQVTLHSDNGGPMKGSTMLATMQHLGVAASFSRPSVSNDNPYSESLFRTLKYRPEYPEHPFVDIAAARSWMAGFTRWYNQEHLHSAINFVSPNDRHRGADVAILARRHQVYLAAKARHPERWARSTRDWSVVAEVHLNPDKANTKLPTALGA